MATSGTVLAAFPDRPPSLRPPGRPSSVSIWTPNVDSASTPMGRGNPSPHDFFLEPGGAQGGGCIVVPQDSADWSTAPIYVLPFTVPSMAEKYGGLIASPLRGARATGSLRPGGHGLLRLPGPREEASIPPGPSSYLCQCRIPADPCLRSATPTPLSEAAMGS